MDGKTISSISIDNSNTIINCLDLKGLDLTALRIVHSLLDEQRQAVIEHLQCSEEERAHASIDDENDELF